MFKDKYYTLSVHSGGYWSTLYIKSKSKIKLLLGENESKLEKISKEKFEKEKELKSRLSSEKH